MTGSFLYIDTQFDVYIILKKVRGETMQKLYKVLISIIMCLLFVQTGFAAERVVVCEIIGDEE